MVPSDLYLLFLFFYFLEKERRKKNLLFTFPIIIINGVETFFSCKSTIYSIIKYEKKIGKKLFKKKKQKNMRVEYCSWFMYYNQTIAKAELLIIMQTRLHSQ